MRGQLHCRAFMTTLFVYLFKPFSQTHDPNQHKQVTFIIIHMDAETNSANISKELTIDLYALIQIYVVVHGSFS